jgi:chaperone modulatory protein CbpM
MEKRVFSLVVRESGVPERTRSLTLVELADRCGCQLELAERLFRIGLLDTENGLPDHPLFEEDQLFRLRRALRLKRDLGLNIDALPLVLDLLDRIEELEEELRRR